MHWTIVDCATVLVQYAGSWDKFHAEVFPVPSKYKCNLNIWQIFSIGRIDKSEHITNIIPIYYSWYNILIVRFIDAISIRMITSAAIVARENRYDHHSRWRTSLSLGSAANGFLSELTTCCTGWWAIFRPRCPNCDNRTALPSPSSPACLRQRSSPGFKVCVFDRRNNITPTALNISGRSFCMKKQRGVHERGHQEHFRHGSGSFQSSIAARRAQRR